MITDFQVGFPSYDDYKKDPRPSQEIYRQFVYDYFARFGVTMPADMGVQYCPLKETTETTRYPCEIARQSADGTWEQSGVHACGDMWFVGDDKRGYLLATAVLIAWDSYEGVAKKEVDGVNYLWLTRQYLMQHAVFMTGFRILLIPDDARQIHTIPGE